MTANNSIKHGITRALTVLLLVAMLAMPVGTRAATALYQPQTIQEQIAFIYGMITMLERLLAERTDADGDVGVVRPGRGADIDIDTLSARDIRYDEATLRGRVDLDGERSARVWFEFGEDDDDLDTRTTKRRIYDSRGDIQTFTADIDDLDTDERYYYRAVGEDEDGDREYGSIRFFMTDDDDDRNADDFELSVSDTRIDAGDEVDVDWEIPRDEEGDQNWIGLFEEGDDNQDYVDWVYLDDDTDGTETFTIDDEGEYEFRLFLDNSYDDEITSETIDVE